MIRGALSGLVGEYSARLDWDADWATDWSTSDSWSSREDNSWVELAMMQGVYDSFEINPPYSLISTEIPMPFGEEPEPSGFNPLDVFASTSMGLANSAGNAPILPGKGPGSALVWKKSDQEHHIASNKGANKAKFEKLFKTAGISSMNIPENRLRIPHGGQHSKQYNDWVYKRLDASIVGKTGDVATKAFKAELARVGNFIAANPHFLYNSIGRKSTNWNGLRHLVRARGMSGAYGVRRR
jgi:hypothetical protein